MGNFQKSISYFFSLSKLSFDKLYNEEKLEVIGSYISSYVHSWDILEALNESRYGEDFAYSMVRFFKRESDGEEMIEDIKKTYIDYYSDIVKEKFDEACMELCNQEIEKEYVNGMGYYNVK